MAEVQERALTNDRLWAPQYRLLTAGLVGTITLAAFEALAVITVLPLIRNDLGGLGLYGWVVSAFSLGTLFGIVAAGEQADRIGPARPFVIGLVLFAGGLVVGGFAPTMPVLVVGRALQGIGAGAIPAVAYVCIGRTYPESLRPRVFAILSTAWVVPGLIGPALSVVVAQRFGWRAVLLGLLPLVAATGALAVPAMLHLRPQAPARAAPRRLLDALRMTVGAALLLAAFSGHEPASVALLAAAVVVGLRPLLRLIPGGTFRAASPLAAAVLARGLLTFTFFSVDTFVPLEITAIRGHGPALAGVAITAATIAWTTGAWVQVRLATRWSAHRQVATGFLIVVCGIATVSAGLLTVAPVALIVCGWGVGGLGMGLGYSPLSIVVLRHARPDAQGASSAALQLFDNLGVALGAGIAGALVAVFATSGSPTSAGLGAAFAVAIAAGCAGVAVAWRLPGGR
ncbi:MAG: MFS transporter [Candidatus Dormibacteraeota bacterium]|uniref:MFS transporter n=1 Tax=Candidatus Amunia macphersoniae TaxID=3127014 RepID=A0A934NFK2_9BACT|nr:MFS transporter [Candidatus Dormibacteraeota bacterium]